MRRLSRGGVALAIALALGVVPAAQPALAAAPTASAGARQAAKDLQLLHSWMAG